MKYLWGYTTSKFIVAKTKTSNRIFSRTLAVLVSAFLRIFSRKVCLICWLSLMFYILCLKRVMKTPFLHYCKLSQPQMAAVATGHIPLNITYNQFSQSSVLYFKRHCILSWKYVLIHKRHEPFWKRLMSEAWVVLSWTLVYL